MNPITVFLVIAQPNAALLDAMLMEGLLLLDMAADLASAWLQLQRFPAEGRPLPKVLWVDVHLLLDVTQQQTFTRICTTYPITPVLLVTSATASAFDAVIEQFSDYAFVFFPHPMRWVRYLFERAIQMTGLQRDVAAAKRLLQEQQQARLDLGEQIAQQGLIEAMYEISQAASSVENLQALFERVYQIINRFILARNCYIALYDAESDVLSFPFFVDEFDAPPPPHKMTEGLTAMLIRLGKPMMFTPESAKQLLQGFLQTMGTPAHYWLGVPLKTADGITIGALVVQSYVDGVGYTDDDQRFLMFVSTQIAMAIVNRRTQDALRAREQADRAQLEALVQQRTVELQAEVQQRTQLYEMLQREHRLFAGGPAVVFVAALHDKDTVLEYVSENVNQFGYKVDDFLTEKLLFRDLVHPLDRGRVFKEIEQFLKQARQSFEQDYRIVCADGSTRWVYTYTSISRDANASITHFHWYVIDVSNHKATEQALRESEERYRLLFERLPVGVFHYDRLLRITAINTRFIEILRSSPVRLQNFDMNQLKDRRVLPALRAVLFGQEGVYQGEYVTTTSGYTIMVNLRTTPFISDNGEILGGVGIVEDITDRHQMEERILHQTLYDALTGLPNRYLLQDRLHQAILQARQEQTLVGVVFLDLERFKNINDTLGHPIGDAILQQVAERLRIVSRHQDTLARLGADDFVLVITGIRSEAELEATLQCCLNALRPPFEVGEHRFYVDFTTGYSIYPQDSEDPTTLLKHADNALTFAKQSGQQHVQRFRPAMNTLAQERLELSNQLRVAMDNNELLLRYHPQIDLANFEVLGFEALLRWQHPQQGAISPGTFVPLAEETGLILPLGQWVFEQACLQARLWQEQNLPPFRISVNVSVVQFLHSDFIQNIERTLLEYSANPEYLAIELTESVFLHDHNEAAGRIRSLRDLGLLVYLDDFGMAYSSLAYLRRLPINALKLDQAFVHDLTTPTAANLDPGALVKTIITLGHSLNLKVIAEGVESQQQVDVLRDLGCDGVQGFWFARPMLAENVLTWLADWARRRTQFYGAARVPSRVGSSPL